jgi:excisionase family DNA binding protein
MTTMTAPPLLGTREAAERLGCTRATLHKLIEVGDHRGRLPAFRVGGHLKVDPAELEAFLEARRA